MATRAMIFIDGSWMYHNKKHIIEAFEEESYDIDYSKILELVKDHIQNFLHTEIDLIRTSFFASIPKNDRPALPGLEQNHSNLATGSHKMVVSIFTHKGKSIYIRINNKT